MEDIPPGVNLFLVELYAALDVSDRFLDVEVKPIQPLWFACLDPLVELLQD